jgi:hypothetical protein
MRTLKTLGLVAIVAAGVMVYAEVRTGSVTHPHWARMLLRAIELEDDLPADATTRLVFSTLSWKQSLAYPAERYLRARGVDVVGPAGARQVVATQAVAEVAYPVAVVRGGDYRLRLEIAGHPGQPAAADITAVGQSQPLRQFTLSPPASSAWIEVGAAHLDPGAYTAAVTLPAGSTLRRVEVAPRCLTAIEPPGGWRDAAVATADDVAVTVLQALDKVSELPPADAPMERTASDFRLTEGAGATLPAPESGLWVRGGARGARALLVVDLPTAGLYTLSVFGLASTPQGWLVDECQKAILCPQPERVAAGPGWRPVLTAPFTAGRHSFAVTLPPGSELGRVRLERKKDGPADYRATLARLGFDVGAPGPIPREKADAAVDFIKGQRRNLPRTGCGDVPPPGALEAGLPEPAAPNGAHDTVTAGRPPDGVGVPLPGPPVTTPTPPVTVPPVTVPPVTTPPEPLPPDPTGPPPTVPPGPTPTVPPQPPGSPVTVSPTPPPVP